MIPISRRCDRAVAEDLLAAYVAHGSVGANLQLPPDWDKDGIYDNVVNGTKCTITNKDNGNSCTFDVPRCAQMAIDIGFSENRAIIRVKGNSTWRKRISAIFAEEGTHEASPCSKLFRMRSKGKAITDKRNRDDEDVVNDGETGCPEVVPKPSSALRWQAKKAKPTATPSVIALHDGETNKADKAKKATSLDKLFKPKCDG